VNNLKEGQTVFVQINGVAIFRSRVPMGLAGVSVWFQAMETNYDGLSNSVAAVTLDTFRMDTFETTIDLFCSYLNEAMAAGDI